MVIIRDAVLTDLTLLCEFNQAMAVETEDKPLSGDILAKGIKAVFDDPELGFYLIASINEQTAGALMVTREWSDWRNSLFWWIQSVYILPEFRRQGVFQSLYQEVKHRARSDGRVCGLRLYVEQENEKAQRTYKAMGMLETGYRLYEEEFQATDLSNH